MSTNRRTTSLYGPNHDGLGSETNRPRRPNADTLSYCQALPISLEVAKTELRGICEQQQYDDSMNKMNQEELEFMLPTRMAAQSAIEEIQNEIASLCGDDNAAQTIENLVQVVSLSSSSVEVSPKNNNNTSFSSPSTSDEAMIKPDLNSIYRVLLGLKGYHLHLASHRYGSHVVQTVFECVSKALSTTTTETDEESQQEEEIVTKITDEIQEIALELFPFAKELICHVCGTHVIRALMCLFGGVYSDASSKNPQEDGNFRRGKDKNNKKKKKKKKKPAPGATGGRNQSLVMFQQFSYNSNDTKHKFDECLTELTNVLIENTSSQELQDLVCHPSAGPLFVTLLRVLCLTSNEDGEENTKKKVVSPEEMVQMEHKYRHLGILPKNETKYKTGSLADKFVKAVLNFPDNKEDQEEGEETKSCGDVIYELSGEQTGSVFIETIMRTCDDPTFYTSFCHEAQIIPKQQTDNEKKEKGDGFIKDYLSHNVSNYVIQTLLATCPTKDLAESFLKILLPFVTTPPPDNNNKVAAVEGGQQEHDDDNDTNNDVVKKKLPLLLQKNRRGVLCRLAELCAKWRIGQETLLNGICIGFASVNTNKTTTDSNSNTPGVEEEEGEKKGGGGKKRKRKKKKPTLPLHECIKKLLNSDIRSTPANNNTSVQNEARISLDVNGARIIYHLLHFVPRLCENILDALVTKMSKEELEKIATDGLGSRSIMEGILSNPSTKVEPFPSYICNLREKLQDRWTFLSMDRIGHHIVKKLFHALPTIIDKYKLTEELAYQGKNRLQGIAMGRAVMQECFVSELIRGGEYKWKDAVKKKMRQDEWLKEIVNTSTNNNNDDDDGEKENKGMKKQKNKGENSSDVKTEDPEESANTNNANANESVGTKKRKRKRRRKA